MMPLLWWFFLSQNWRFAIFAATNFPSGPAISKPVAMSQSGL